MQRLTKKWTPTLVEAYGDGVQKARQAELLVMEAFAGWGYEVIDRETIRIGRERMLPRSTALPAARARDEHRRLSQESCGLSQAAAGGGCKPAHAGVRYLILTDSHTGEIDVHEHD